MTAVSTITSDKRVVSLRAQVPASAKDIFDLVADPHRHAELDGSGTVRDQPVKGPDRLSEGAKFSVKMKQYGVPYAITSRCTAFEEDRVVEWRHPAGHRWRWELEETAPGSTRVTETWDATDSKVAPVFSVMGVAKQNEAGIRSTLEQLVKRFS